MKNLSLFDKIFGSKKERDIRPETVFKTLNAYRPVFHDWNGSIYESELVRAAIHALAAHTSKMNVKIHGSARPTLQTKLKAAPNEWQTWSQFLYRLRTILEVNNTAFIVPVIDQYDETTGIYALLPERCEFVEYNGTVYLRYRFSTGETASIEKERCGILTKHQYKHDLIGESNKALTPTMALLDIQNQGIREGVKSAATYTFMAKLNNFSLASDLAKERKRFSEENLRTDSDASGLLLFPNTYSDIKQIESKPFVVDDKQMALIDENIFSYFGVNRAVIQNSATSDMLDAFYNGALEPFAIQLSEVLTKMLFTLREQANGSRITVTSDRLQYMSVSDKLNLITSMGDRGMITINEARELLNYEPVDGGDELMPIRGEYYNAAETTPINEEEENADNE